MTQFENIVDLRGRERHLAENDDVVDAQGSRRDRLMSVTVKAFSPSFRRISA